MMQFVLSHSIVFVISVLLFALPANAKDNLLFILDSSNSMWGQIEGRAKIDIAKEALENLVSDLPEATGLALIAYGHRSKSDCGDIELLAPIGASAKEVSDRLRRLTPTGKTPMASALRASVPTFQGAAAGNNNSVVLISDGVETCGGDPCAEAEKLASAGLGVKVHVVGFDIPEKDRKQLECIAEKGEGRYFTADSTDGFGKAVTAAVDMAQAEPPPAAAVSPPEPPPPDEPVREQIFFDDFDGGDLAEDWVVHNADPNAYLVEDGNLLMLSSAVAGFDNAETANIVQLARDLPNGDWDVNARLTAQLKTAEDRVWLGLRQDEANFLATTITHNQHNCCGGCNGVFLSFLKMTNGELARFDHLVRGIQCNSPNDVSAEELGTFVESLAEKPITLTLAKRGRDYFGVFRVEGDVDQEGRQREFKTDRMASLRAPGQLAITLGKSERIDGELLIAVDSVEIETVKQAP